MAGNAAASRHIEVLCQLPLTQLALVKAIAESLHHVVPSRWNIGGLFLDMGGPGPGYGEFQGYPVMAARWQIECAPYFSATLTVHEVRSNSGVGQTLAIQKPGYEQSEIYQKVFRPFGVKWFLDVTLRDDDGVMAGFMLLRGPDERRFSAGDCRSVEAALPSMVRGFRANRQRLPVDQPTAPIATASGYALVTSDGQLRAMTKPARQILELMAAEAYDLSNYTTAARRFLATTIAAIGTQDDASNADLVEPRRGHRVVNGLGEFHLSLASLDAMQVPGGIPEDYEALPNDGRDEPLLSLLIEYHEPLALHLARAMRQAGLAPRQVHVGVLAAMGQSQTEIANELGVKRSSVDDAVRKIYARTGVRSAIDLAWHFARR